MLKKVKPELTKNMEILIKGAAFPAPFANVLEFNSPAHGTWNIVHMGMLVPEARQIYVCAYNCMRGVVLTAAEMNAQERFSFVILEEEDMISGKLEDVTIEGVAACIRKLEKQPPVVLLFTVCVHQFLGCDLDYIYRKLGEMFPNIFFARCFMDCLLQKKGPTPDQKLRKSMYDPIRELPVKNGIFSLVGSDLPLDNNSDLKRLISEAGGTLKEISTLKDYQDYLSMGESEAFVVTYPSGKMGGEKLAERLQRPFLYLPMSFDYEEIKEEWKRILVLLEKSAIGRKETGVAGVFESRGNFEKFEERIAEEICQCEDTILRTADFLGSTPISIDYTYHPRPLGLARLLLSHGFVVERVYLDGILPEEEKDFLWLQKEYPELTLVATMKPECRTMERNHPEVLAIGQKAAWFEGTDHFVNVVQGGGLFGFSGIRETMRLIEEAYKEPKDTKNLIIRKGWGCESCI